MNGSWESRTCKNGVAGARDEEAEEPGCPQQSSAGPRGACLLAGELSITPLSLALNCSHCKIQLHRLHASCQQVHTVLSLELLVVLILLLHLI